MGISVWLGTGGVKRLLWQRPAMPIAFQCVCVLCVFVSVGLYFVYYGVGGEVGKLRLVGF